jgi:hypothetical protein
MSHLKLYRPEGQSFARWDGPPEAGRPQILSLSTFAVRSRNRRVLNIVARARLLHENRECPYCAHPVVEPIELEDGLIGRNRLPIPGTATLVGFNCARCRAEWPV